VKDAFVLLIASSESLVEFKVLITQYDDTLYSAACSKEVGNFS